jgi:hypothetical protein
VNGWHDVNLGFVAAKRRFESTSGRRAMRAGFPDGVPSG